MGNAAVRAADPGWAALRPRRSDDKGPSLIAIETLGAFLRLEGRLPVNVKVLLEGEEETGSSTSPRYSGGIATLLAADAVISADGARWRADLPTVTVATRGNAGFEFAVTTAAKDPRRLARAP